MSWFSRLFGRRSPPPTPKTPSDAAYDAAMGLSDEVLTKIRERSDEPNPFRVVLSSLLLGTRYDTALVADAFEIAQESQIFRGPPNGHG